MNVSLDSFSPTQNFWTAQKISYISYTDIFQEPKCNFWHIFVDSIAVPQFTIIEPKELWLWDELACPHICSEYIPKQSDCMVDFPTTCIFEESGARSALLVVKRAAPNLPLFHCTELQQ